MNEAAGTNEVGCNCSGHGRNVRDQVTRSGGSGSNGDDGSSRKQWLRASARSGSGGNGSHSRNRKGAMASGIANGIEGPTGRNLDVGVSRDV